MPPRRLAPLPKLVLLASACALLNAGCSDRAAPQDAVQRKSERVFSRRFPAYSPRCTLWYGDLQAFDFAELVPAASSSPKDFVVNPHFPSQPASRLDASALKARYASSSIAAKPSRFGEAYSHFPTMVVSANAATDACGQGSSGFAVLQANMPLFTRAIPNLDRPDQPALAIVHDFVADEQGAPSLMECLERFMVDIEVATRLILEPSFDRREEWSAAFAEMSRRADGEVQLSVDERLVSASQVFVFGDTCRSAGEGPSFEGNLLSLSYLGSGSQADAFVHPDDEERVLQFRRTLYDPLGHKLEGLSRLRALGYPTDESMRGEIGSPFGTRCLEARRFVAASPDRGGDRDHPFYASLEALAKGRGTDAAEKRQRALANLRMMRRLIDDPQLDYPFGLELGYFDNGEVLAVDVSEVYRGPRREGIEASKQAQRVICNALRCVGEAPQTLRACPIAENEWICS